MDVFPKLESDQECAIQFVGSEMPSFACYGSESVLLFTKRVYEATSIIRTLLDI